MKIIKDCIYGYIKIPTLCQLFMDVPEFQKLRRIKQLGNVSRVYPSATHTRFEHSLGVMHLAGQLCKVLKIKKEKHLIQLAGLYHDIGHLPYSHLFDKALKIIQPHNVKINHEERSIELFLNVSSRLKILSKEEEEFVCACIKGVKLPNQPRYLFEIIASSIDVDKLDYLCRDAYHTGMPSFQSNYILMNAKIVNGHIGFRKKTLEDIKDMFETRNRMHELVYQHPVSLQYDSIFICMIIKLHEHGVFQGDFDYYLLCDYKLDTLLMTSVTSSIYQSIDYRHKNHDDYCNDKSHNVCKHIEKSGDIKDIIFI